MFEKLDKIDHDIVRTYDQHDRVTKITYGKGEVETFAYDVRGRIAKHTREPDTDTVFSSLFSFSFFPSLCITSAADRGQRGRSPSRVAADCALV